MGCGSMCARLVYSIEIRRGKVGSGYLKSGRFLVIRFKCYVSVTFDTNRQLFDSKSSSCKIKSSAGYKCIIKHNKIRPELWRMNKPLAEHNPTYDHLRSRPRQQLRQPPEPNWRPLLPWCPSPPPVVWLYWSRQVVKKRFSESGFHRQHSQLTLAYLISV